MNRLTSLLRLGVASLMVMAFSAAALAGAAAQDSVAAEDVTYQDGESVVVFDGPLNLRAEPGLDGEVLSSLAVGDVLIIVDGPESADDAAWYQVSTVDDEVGWVSDEFIEPAAVDAEFAAGDEVLIVDGPLNLRAAPGSSAAIVSSLEQDASAIVVSGPRIVDGYNWYSVDIDDGRTGWVASDFLGLASEQTDNTVDAPVEDGFGIGTIVFVNTDVLNLRSDASLDANVVEELTEGQYGTVFEGPVSAENIEWYRVAIVGANEDSTEGWVAGEFLSGGLTLNSEAVVADGPLNLREDASLDAAVVTQLETDDAVQVMSGPVVADGIAWMEVQIGDDNGYAAGQYLTDGDETGTS